MGWNRKPITVEQVQVNHVSCARAKTVLPKTVKQNICRGDNWCGVNMTLLADPSKPGERTGDTQSKYKSIPVEPHWRTFGVDRDCDAKLPKLWASRMHVKLRLLKWNDFV